MGNQIGTQVCSCEEIYRSQSFDNSFQPSTKPRFGSILRLWRYYPDPEDELFVRSSPIDLREFTHFQDESCYIVLHTFLSPELQNQCITNDQNGSGSPNSKLQLSAAELGVSAKQQLSPRGQRNAFGGIHSVAKSLQPPELNKHPVHYDIYIWHGIEAPQIVKANILAKGFELDENLKQMSHRSTLPLYYEQNASIFPIGSFLQLGDTLDEWKRQSERNHLFQWISKLYLPTTNVPNKSSSPPSSKRNKKPRNLVRGSVANSSHAVLPHAATPSPTNRRVRKLARKGKEDQKKTQHHTSVGNSPLASPAKKNLPKLSLQDFRSISLPASEINRVCALAEGLDGDNLRIDLSELPKSKESSQGSRVAPPESKASKIARCDKICSRITESLFLGSDTIAQSAEILKENNITHVLNCAGTICPDYHPDKFVYKTLYLCDGTKEDIACLFYEVLDFIDSSISNGGKVFVHCHQGISRSSAMLILYLMWKDHSDYTSTHERVKAIRAVTNPNAGFTCQLLNWWSLHTAKKKKILFSVFPHCLKAPDQYILKEVSKDKFSSTMLDQRGCFILWTTKRLFLWIGKDCSSILVDQGHLYVSRLQKFEKAPKVRIEKQGNESERFLSWFPDYSTRGVHVVDEYNDSYDLVARTKEKAENTISS